MYKVNSVFALYLGLLLIMLIPGIAVAGNGSGCGLGKMVFNGQSGMFPHLMAATTNGTSYSQSFGITSGTSGCDPENAVVKAEENQTQFVANNMEQLMNDISRGQGEYLTAYGQLLGCSASSVAVLSTSLQENYGEVVTNGLTASNVLSNTKTIIHRTPQLHTACSAS